MYIFTSSIIVILYFLPARISSLPLSISLFKNVRFENIVIFGDSMSDNGNVYALTNQTYPIPPYWNGRYSNGPNWVDQLNISGVSDYAYGSATTDSNLIQGYTKDRTVPVPGIRQQVDIYLNKTNVNQIDFEHTLYILWGGGNDFLFSFSLLPDAIVRSLFNSVQVLLDIGATNILIFNQMPVRYLPITEQFGNPEGFDFLTDLANSHIINLTESMQLNNSQASLNIFDIHSLVLNIVTENSTYFTNTVDNCWLNANATTVLQFCPDPETYLFVDELHFTNRAHGLIADAIRPLLFDSNPDTSTDTSTPQLISTNTVTPQLTSTDTSTSQPDSCYRSRPHIFLLSFFFLFSLDVIPSFFLI